MWSWYLKKGLKYIRYLLTARTKYGIHSPFVYKLVTEVLEDNRMFYGYETVKKLRTQLLRDDTLIRVKDYGGGSRVDNRMHKTISSLANHSSISPKYGQLLFRLVHYFEPDKILELGTALGISTSYMAWARPSTSIYTLEGCPEQTKVAQSNFEQQQLSNIKVHQGNFKNNLPDVLEQMQQVDFALFDGDHRKGSTLHYFEQCLPYFTNDSVLVIDDLHHNAEMEAAWEAIKSYSQVTVTINLFRMGLVFFRTEQVEEHFTIRF
jgi:predicted O-methyltransferase YrrM